MTQDPNLPDYEEPDDPITAAIKKSVATAQAPVPGGTATGTTGGVTAGDVAGIPIDNTGIGGTPSGVPAPDVNGGGFAGPAVPDVSTPAKPVRPWDAPDWKGNESNPRGMVLGFDTDKLNTPGAGSAAKYSDTARLFSQGIAKNVGVSRGHLDNMILYAQDHGFPNAKAVSDDKIDFGDGKGPIDVVRSDGQLVFQDTTDNPQWEASRGGSAGAAEGGMPPNPLMESINPALGSSDFFQKLLDRAKGQAGLPATDEGALLSLLGA